MMIVGFATSRRVNNILIQPEKFADTRPMLSPKRKRSRRFLRLPERAIIRPQVAGKWVGLEPLKFYKNDTAWKVSVFCVILVPIFPHRLNTVRYSVSLRIQSECGKIRTRTTPNTDTFYAAWCKRVYDDWPRSSITSMDHV